MEGASNAHCLGCGTSVEAESQVVGTLEDGRNCGLCAERLLESLPAAMPRKSAYPAHPAQWTLLSGGETSAESEEPEAAPVGSPSIFAVHEDDRPEPA